MIPSAWRSSPQWSPTTAHIHNRIISISTRRMLGIMSNGRVMCSSNVALRRMPWWCYSGARPRGHTQYSALQFKAKQSGSWRTSECRSLSRISGAAPFSTSDMHYLQQRQVCKLCCTFLFLLLRTSDFSRLSSSRHCRISPFFALPATTQRLPAPPSSVVSARQPSGTQISAMSALLMFVRSRSSHRPHLILKTATCPNGSWD
mmetsp:Transcript_28608/g.47433  ORF Transcript_28608/g.47433 Transcript_28608/m.47433 type:complete len:203 (+) Transcript_28608:142-750(+)